MRTGGAPGLPVPLLRAAIERELSRLSLRQVAREVRLSPNALRNFIQGSNPRRTTRVRMERWLEGRPVEARGPTLQRFVRLLGEVTPDLPPTEAGALGREVSLLLLDAYLRRRLPAPRWVRELARHYRAERS